MPNDTHPRIDAMMVEACRRMTPAEKFARIQALNEGVLQMAAARIRREYEPACERELRLRVAALWLDDGTMRHAFDWDPEVQGR
ncbi:MAG: hypothetical protein JW751_20730 [Polyangiaceae bacterium]|nr:hypothetical protein [Polyangiaceae bacterium]